MPIGPAGRHTEHQQKKHHADDLEIDEEREAHGAHQDEGSQDQRHQPNGGKGEKKGVAKGAHGGSGIVGRGRRGQRQVSCFSVHLATQCTRTRERAPRQRQCDGRPYLRAGEYHTHARDRRRRYTDAIRLDDPRYIVEISELSMLWRAVDISKAQTGRGRYLALSKPSSGEITIAPAPRHPCRGKWPRSFPFSGGIARDLDRPLQ